MKTNAAGIALIKRFEGCRLKAYKCPAGVWTIGWGHTEGVKEGHTVSQHQADVMLEYDLGHYEAGVKRLLDGAAVTPNQFAALVSFAYNCGLANLEASTLLKKVRAGNIGGAANEFLKWTRAAGKVLPGLEKRRAAERDLFLGVVAKPVPRN